MAKNYYYNKKKAGSKKLSKILSIIILITGAVIFLYVFFPFFSWQIYFAPIFASQKISAPIPQADLVTGLSVADLLSAAGSSITKDFTDAYNWYPYDKNGGEIKATYTLSIPKLNITDAIVTNKDTDFSEHLVQYNSDSVPPNPGNTVIFGHSTLPQLYDPENYKTIFANLYKLEVGDKVIVKVANIEHSYKIESITVVEPEDTSVLAQNFSDSFLTLITCTPPGTVWKRLILKARIDPVR